MVTHPSGQMPRKLRVAIFISGRGSNMASLVKAANEPAFPAEIALIISNRPDAEGLRYAQNAGIACEVVDHKQFHEDREAFEQQLQTLLEINNIQFICLAGFMRLLTAGFVERWSGKILNIHPALLPDFKGLHTHERAIQAQVKIHGASVHFVVPKMDSGPLLVRVPIKIRKGESVERLAARVLTIEHRIYPAALKLVAEGRVTIRGDYCFVDGQRINGRLLFRFNDRRRCILKERNAFALINMARRIAAA
jgi:phosphoribosylglycinamide formyltransferase-1